MTRYQSKKAYLNGKLPNINVFIWAIPRSLFRSFRAIFRNKNEDFSGILTGIVGVVGEHADHLTTATASPNINLTLPSIT